MLIAGTRYSPCGVTPTLHTSNPAAAFAFGNRLGPEQAYRFARGETVTAAAGLRVQLARPLDFLVVADHGVATGATMELYKGNAALFKDKRLRRWHEMMNESPEQGVIAAGELISVASQGDIPPDLLNSKIAYSVWSECTETAELFNEPGRFTATIGYEWAGIRRRRVWLQPGLLRIPAHLSGAPSDVVRFMAPRACVCWCVPGVAGIFSRRMLAAMRDRYCGNPDRLQIVKGWVDKKR